MNKVKLVTKEQTTAFVVMPTSTRLERIEVTTYVDVGIAKFESDGEESVCIAEWVITCGDQWDGHGRSTEDCGEFHFLKLDSTRMKGEVLEVPLEKSASVRVVIISGVQMS